MASLSAQINPFMGLHLLGDIWAVDHDIVRDEAIIVAGLARGIKLSGASICGLQIKHFEPEGLSVLYLLAESHVSVHTYPQAESLFFDAFTCGRTCDPGPIATTLIEVLGHCKHNLRLIERGFDSTAPHGSSGDRASNRLAPTGTERRS